MHRGHVLYTLQSLTCWILWFISKLSSKASWALRWGFGSDQLWVYNNVDQSVDWISMALCGWSDFVNIEHLPWLWVVLTNKNVTWMKSKEKVLLLLLLSASSLHRRFLLCHNPLHVALLWNLKPWTESFTNCKLKINLSYFILWVLNILSLQEKCN